MIILVLPSPADDNNTMLVKTRTADERINQKLLTGRTFEEPDQHQWWSLQTFAEMTPTLTQPSTHPPVATDGV